MKRPGHAYRYNFKTERTYVLVQLGNSSPIRPARKAGKNAVADSKNVASFQMTWRLDPYDRTQFTQCLLGMRNFAHSRRGPRMGKNGKLVEYDYCVFKKDAVWKVVQCGQTCNAKTERFKGGTVLRMLF